MWLLRFRVTGKIRTVDSDNLLLASRKELVDLEKWLGNNLTTYKDFFFEERLKFLKEIQFENFYNFEGFESKYWLDYINQAF
ncbi:hypothetical protein Q3G72_013863 [Acer saccharum]|nr:hypothetical protein Q3G72_013863 [Acer saccharum]